MNVKMRTRRLAIPWFVSVLLGDVQCCKLVKNCSVSCSVNYAISNLAWTNQIARFECAMH